MPTIVVLGQQFGDGERARLVPGLIKALTSVAQLEVAPSHVVIHFLTVATYTSDLTRSRPSPVAAFVYLQRKPGRTPGIIREVIDRVGAIIVGECEKGTKISIRVRRGEADDFGLLTVE